LTPAGVVIPEGLPRLERLRKLANAKLGELKRTVDLKRTLGLAAALEVVETDAGLDEMNQIRVELKRLLSDAMAARQAKRNSSVTATASTNLIVTLGGAALFLSLAFATLMIEQDQQRRRSQSLEVEELNRTLERKVRARTLSLEEANGQLEAFCYTVSHDLRAPLRSVDGFSKMLVRDYSSRRLDARAQDLLRRMSASTLRMGQLIDDLLNLSRIGRAGIEPADVDLSGVAAVVSETLAAQNPGHRVEVSIEPGLRASGDRQLLRVALENLFANAWKFTRHEAQPRLAFGRSDSGGETVFYVRDNGVGFDVAHSGQLFTPFQRLHSEREFEGNGIGLATVHRVIQSHGGRIWAESNPGQGATFYFTVQGQRRTIFDGTETDSDGGGQPRRRTAHA
jgi:signal transduction histidine kinase